MKKLFTSALAVTLCLLMMTSAVTVFAADYNKINTKLQQQLENLDNEKTTVWVEFLPADVESLKDEMLDMESLEEEMLNDDDYYENMDLYESYNEYMLLKRERIREKTHEMTQAYREAVQKIYINSNSDYLDKCNIAQDDVIFISSAAPMVIVTLTKEKIEEISNYDFVRQIYLYEDEFSSVEPTTAKVGDIDNNGSVDINDVTLIQKYLINNSGQRVNTYCYDVNADGEITIDDVTELQKNIAEN